VRVPGHVPLAGRQSLHHLRTQRILDADHGGDAHRRVAHQAFLDRRRADAVTGAGDDVIIAAEVADIAGLIHVAQVPGEQELARKFFAGGLSLRQ
jgi:hypothetical protein